MIVGVEITAEDIVAGACESETACAAAIALKRALPGREIEVWQDVLVIDGVEIGTPPELTRFVRRFYLVHAVEPISFEIDVPEART